jgi:uncharacterized protein
MKRNILVASVSALSFLLVLLAIPLTSTSAPAPKLPKVISITTLPEGSAKYNQTAAVRAAVEQFGPMKLRLESSATDLTRVGPLAMGQAELAAITGGLATGAAKGESIFNKLGPVPIRRVWNGFPFVGAMYSRGNAGFKTLADLRGKRLPQSPGAYEWSLNNAGILAFGGLTLDDVKIVTVSGIQAALKGPLEGTLDATQGSLFSSAVVELAASAHGVHWFDMPASDTEGWKRQKKVAPWAMPVKTGAAGLKEGQTITGAGYEDGIYSTSAVSEEIIYTFCAAMFKGIDVYRKMDKGLLQWTWERAYSIEVMPYVPYHPGAVKFFKEKGVWSSAHEAIQQEGLKAEKERLKK